VPVVWQESDGPSPSDSGSEVKKADGSTLVGSLVDVSLASDSGGNGTVQGHGTQRSRTPSVSSQASDASVLASPSMTVGRQSSSVVSAAEDGVSETENDDHSATVASMTKEELDHVYSKALRRGHQYKMKYMQVNE